MGGYCSNHNTLGAEPNYTLVYDPVSELHNPTMSMIGGNIRQLYREREIVVNNSNRVGSLGLINSSINGHNRGCTSRGGSSSIVINIRRAVVNLKCYCDKYWISTLK